MELKNLAVLVRDTLQEFDGRERLMRRRILLLQHQRDQLNYQLESNSNTSQTPRIPSQQLYPESTDNDIEILRNLVSLQNQHVDPLWFKRVRQELNDFSDEVQDNGQVLVDSESRRRQLDQNQEIDLEPTNDGDRLSDTVLDAYNGSPASSSYSSKAIPPRPPARQSLRESEDSSPSQFLLNNNTTKATDMESSYKYLTEAFEKLADENIRNSIAVHQIIKEYRQRGESS